MRRGRRNRRVVRNARGVVRLALDGRPIARGRIVGDCVEWIIAYDVVESYDIDGGGRIVRRWW